MSADPARLAELMTRAAGLAERGRCLLGITGPPGAGKSALAAALAGGLPAVVVPMDGFHLPDAELRRLGRLGRKGAPDTFDATSYIALLRRLRTGNESVRAPAFNREREETIADSIAVPRATSLVITEGNYLLLDDEPWRQVRAIVDEVWFIDHPRRVERLVARHVSHGHDRADAFARATTGSDADNARLVTMGRDRADLVLAHGWLTA